MPASDGLSKHVALKDSSLKTQKAAPAGKRITVWDSLCPGLALRVTDKGRRSFYAVKRLAGASSPTWARLGAYPVMTLAAAREAARQALLALEAGQHPAVIAEKKRHAAEAAAREAEASTFAAVAKQFAAAYLGEVKPATRRLYHLYLRNDLVPSLGAKPVGEITRREVTALISEIKARRGKASAIGALSVLRKLFNWSLGNGVPGIEVSPAAGIDTKIVIGKTEARTRKLADAELAAVWHAIPAVGEPFATLYKLLLLTGLRYNEVAGAVWDDINFSFQWRYRVGKKSRVFTCATLTIPEARSKTHREMVVPLPPAAVELLRALPRYTGGDFIFSATGGRTHLTAFSGAKARLDTALGSAVKPFVIHDFRRNVRSALSRLGVSDTVGEMCLGHVLTGVRGTYDRHDFFVEKRDALLLWEADLLHTVAPTSAGGGKVVPLRVQA